MTKSLDTSLEVREHDADFGFSASRVGLVFTLLRARTGMLIKLNFLLAIFAIPAIVALYLHWAQSAFISAVMPYSASFGVGYPVITDAAAMAAKLMFQNDMRLHVWMACAIALLSVALSGGFYVMRKLARGETFPIIKNYFVGVKRHAIPFLCAAPFLAGLYYLIAGGISAFGEIPMPTPLKVFLLAVIGLFAILILMTLIFFFTQTVTFKIGVGTLLKNSLILACKLLARNIVVLVFTALPLVLLFWMLTIDLLSVIGVMLALAFLFSYIVLVWTVYAHWVFDKFFDSAESQDEQAVVLDATEAVEVPEALASPQAAQE